MNRCAVVPRVYYWRRSPGRSVQDPVVLVFDPAPSHGSRNPSNWRIIGAMKREVGAELEIEITAPTTLEFQIAVAPHPNTEVFESLSFVLDGNPFQPLEISGVHGNRIHKLDVPVGNLTVDYSATIVGRTDPAPVTEYDLSMYLRPSRYAEADKFYGFAATEFGNYVDSTTLLEKVSSWVGTRLNYVPGSSDPIDGAVDTLLAGAGVCRDFAHLLVVALLRAVKVPARVVSVYAPGLWPMDFHAVAEALVDGQWRWSTRHAWRRGRRWCGPPRDATPPTPPSWTTTEARST